MDKQKPNLLSKRANNAALTRPPQLKGEKHSNLSLREAFERATLESNPWGQFLLFVEDSYKRFTPRPREDDQKRSGVVRSAIQLLNEYPTESWDNLLSKLPERERLDADELYKHISNAKKLTPQEVYQSSQSALKGLIENAEYGFLDSENRDIGRIIQLCDAINYFQGNQSKTYLILAQLEKTVSEEFNPMFAASSGFQELISAGITSKLKNFAMTLMKHFRVTHTAIKGEAASNLALGIGEIERNLKTHINILEQQKSELEWQLQESRSKANEEALVKIAESLQNGRQPALEQMQQMIHILESQMDDTGEPEISSEQALSVFIMLRNMMKIFEDMGIQPYPKPAKGLFKISKADVSDYSYIEGDPFTDEDEIKEVECLRQGWKVGDTVITPAQVREVRRS